ncbi:uncharacterized protein LOC124256167 [Haliotis rubra]|uniref:uncharacterized protein LOC124256167 n=1 Tax=Haliotis rubra TaxID=36100 RepID=UPI001EE60920|nr:uncharacterized protein LOC124256167 [Haliotis rubra]
MEIHWNNRLGSSSIVPALVLILQLYIDVVWGKQCLKNQQLGDVTGNTYQCEDATKPECCEKDSSFTCCEPAATRNLIEQVQLWGIVSAIAIIIGVLLFCLCKDVNYCASDKTVKEKVQEVLCRRNNKLDDASKCDSEYDDINTGPSTSPVISLSSSDPSTRPTTVEKM